MLEIAQTFPRPCQEIPFNTFLETRHRGYNIRLS